MNIHSALMSLLLYHENIEYDKETPQSQAADKPVAPFSF